MASRNFTAEDRARISERRNKAIDLKLTGLSYRQIADRLDISHTQARRDVEERLKEDAQKRPQTQQLRQLENHRLDILHQSWWPRALERLEIDEQTGAREGHDPDPAALDRVLRIMERRAKLNGLDMPTQIDVNSNLAAEVYIPESLEEVYAARNAFAQARYERLEQAARGASTDRPTDEDVDEDADEDVD